MSKRVLIAQIMHETNTFSLLPTDEDSYRRRYLGIGDEIVGQFRGTRTELGGFIDAAERFGWTTVNAVAANATPSGKVTAACWTLLKGAVLDALDKQGPVDGCPWTACSPGTNSPCGSAPPSPGWWRSAPCTSITSTGRTAAMP
ncbi:MAG: M81 family metallopeptidase, partial [Oceanibaculum nanhaiense]|nr:M81 family metallopeptidase [Oceanibaculum nanhaiense]